MLTFQRTNILWIFGLIIMFAAGCTNKQTAITTYPEPAFQLQSGKWLVRQKIHLSVPALSINQSFDGIAKVDYRRKSAQIAGLGSMGLTLFNIEITPDSAIVYSIHPGFARIPNLENEIKISARAVLFYALGTYNHPAGANKHETSTIVINLPDGTDDMYTFSGGVLNYVLRNIKNPEWSLSLENTPATAKAGHPDKIYFKRMNPGYTLAIETTLIQKEE